MVDVGYSSSLGRDDKTAARVCCRANGFREASSLSSVALIAHEPRLGL